MMSCVTPSNSLAIVYFLILQFADNTSYVSDKILNGQKRFCGLQHADDYFRTDTEISISEFPWIARLIVNVKKGEYDPGHSLCTGTLINSFYILTTAECLENFPLIDTVRLGDFNTRNKTDCITELGYEDCSDYEDYGIEEKIIHPFRISWTNINDIALLRMNKHVTFTDYIRPICLPLKGTVFAKPGDTLYVSAWGWNQETTFVDFKKKISTTLISNSECKKLLQEQRQGSVGSYQMCTVSSINNTDFPCLFDNGGSLMFGATQRLKWHIEGILTGTYPCSADKPLKYTKVAKYLDWIQENMRPWN